MRCLSVLLLVLTLFRPATAAPDPVVWEKVGGPRVRPVNARIATLLLDGLRRSPALVQLIDQIEASDVIVYLEIQPTLRNSLAGCLTWMEQAGNYRYVRASLSGNLTAEALIATIGHELRHVVEIVEHPSVVDETSFAALYRQIGVGGSRTTNLDTREARETGALVRRDLNATPAAALPGGSTTSPYGWHSWYRQQQLTRY